MQFCFAGYTGESITDVVNIGIGGSDLVRATFRCSVALAKGRNIKGHDRIWSCIWSCDWSLVVTCSSGLCSVFHKHQAMVKICP